MSHFVIRRVLKLCDNGVTRRYTQPLSTKGKYSGTELFHLQIMKTLLEHGARTDVKDQEERTPLHLAAMYVNINVFVFNESMLSSLTVPSF